MTLDLAPRPLPLLTQHLPGIGGAIKVTPEDFSVEELPAYLPSGQGDHLYLWVEKRELGTQEVARLIARATGASERDVGYAGQKDRFATTRQWFSILTKRDAVPIDDPRVRVLAAARHNNKLRVGHSKGNRFGIVVRGVVPDALERARVILAHLERTGLPNFFGPQRFGRRGDNAALGAALLGLGDHPQRARADRDRHLRRLALSALQSEIFNRCLADRMADGTWDRVIATDVLQKRGGGFFTTDDPVVDGERVARGEVDVTGPLPGPRERPQASGEARAREERVLAGCGVPREAFAAGGGEAEGARRAYRIALTGVELASAGADSLVLSFPLPPGSYATRVLAEVMKADADLPEA
ncbi:MAG: tRNA pseudouridine(13) synthase TruD [Deltaproteobacteria bacterium]|nr:tRNA pseudouridine(13) synthase TruD [Deltaproteobacteria bacterium]